MNLILSDVEETIMIVDQVEGAPEGQSTVNVSKIHHLHGLCGSFTANPQVAKRKMEMLFVRGDGVILVRYKFLILSQTFTIHIRCLHRHEHNDTPGPPPHTANLR